MKTTKEQIINELEEIIKYNKAARQASCLELFKDSSRKSNDVLAKAKNYIKSSDEYERGLNDGWELATKVVYMSTDDSFHTFGYKSPALTLERHSGLDARKLYNEYMEEKKKKEEEAAKPKLGDVVEVNGVDLRGVFRYTHKGIYLKETDTTHNILVNNGDIYILEKEYMESIEKTGEHVDIQGMLDNIG